MFTNVGPVLNDFGAMGILNGAHAGCGHGHTTFLQNELSALLEKAAPPTRVQMYYRHVGARISFETSR
jgi:hypothetical protein